ncbi:MAG: YtxH domain-containing protein [Streptococcaceae bacterium]|jgi:gas vesicle protein|nr:YtxH domain-containing protein [Streptococcaceae bacterium]
MAKKSGFLGGAILGAAIGVAAALFAAPKKGTELRKDALEKYHDFKEDPQGAFEDLRDFSVDKFYYIKDRFDSGEYSADVAREFLLQKRDEIKAKVDSGELSVDTVKDFFYKTRDSLSERFSNLTGEQADDGDLSVDYSWTEPDKDKEK